MPFLLGTLATPPQDFCPSQHKIHRVQYLHAKEWKEEWKKQSWNWTVSATVSKMVLVNVFIHSLARGNNRPMEEKVTPANLLNEREQEILRRLSAGLSDQQIADNLFLSLNTIK